MPNAYSSGTDSKLGNMGRANTGGSSNYGTQSQASFLGNQTAEDPLALKRKIAMLEKENEYLKQQADKSALNDQFKRATIQNDDRNWM